MDKLKYFFYLDKTDYDLLPDEMVQACLSSDLLALEKREIETFEEVGDCTIYKKCTLCEKIKKR